LELRDKSRAGFFAAGRRDTRRARPEEALDECASNAAVRAGDQDDSFIQFHDERILRDQARFDSISGRCPSLSTARGTSFDL